MILTKHQPVLAHIYTCILSDLPVPKGYKNEMLSVHETLWMKQTELSHFYLLSQHTVFKQD